MTDLDAILAKACDPLDEGEVAYRPAGIGIVVRATLAAPENRAALVAWLTDAGIIEQVGYAHPSPGGQGPILSPYVLGNDSAVPVFRVVAAPPEPTSAHEEAGLPWAIEQLLKAAATVGLDPRAALLQAIADAAAGAPPEAPLALEP